MHLVGVKSVIQTQFRLRFGMEDRNPSPASSSLSGSSMDKHRRRHREEEEEDGRDQVSCSGKKCQSCTAGAIADCVAVCCCPCAVVNILTLAFFKLPWAVARRLVRGRRKKSSRRWMLEAKSRCAEGTTEKGTTSEIGGEEEVNYDFSSEFREEDVWLELELYEVGHLGFGSW